MENDLIQWPSAKYWTKCWNPVIGCRPISPACDNCYARAWAARFGHGFEPHEAHRLRPPRDGVVFCGNMTDLFGEWLWPSREIRTGRSPVDFLRCANDGRAKHCTYLWLTKRVEAMCDAIDRHAMPRNHYFGFTAENQEWYFKRFRYLREHGPAWCNYWISAEPLLGEIDLELYKQDVQFIKWVVVGCESGSRRRHCETWWIESIVEQCGHYHIPVFVKQLDIGGKCVTDINQFPEHLRVRQVPWRRPE